MNKTVMIAESFDSRRLANMDVALERACKGLSIGAEEHRVRRRIARKILKCAERGDITLGGLTAAALAAATELRAAHGD
jgi:diphthamide synthase subunit DPH2